MEIERILASRRVWKANGAVLHVRGLPPGTEEDVLKKELDKSGEVLDVGVVDAGSALVTVTHQTWKKIATEKTYIGNQVLKVVRVGYRLEGVIYYGGPCHVCMGVIDRL